MQITEHKETTWVFGPLAAAFGIFTAAMATFFMLYFCINSWTKMSEMQKRIAEGGIRDKVELSAKLLKIEGVDPLSVAAFLESEQPENFTIDVGSEKANREADAMFKNYKRFRDIQSRAQIFGVRINKTSVIVVIFGWLVLTSFMLAIAGRRTIYNSPFEAP